MAARGLIAASSAFVVAAAAAFVLPRLDRLARHHRLRQWAGGAGLDRAVAGRPRSVRAGAVLLRRRLRGGAGRPLDRRHRRLRLGADRRRARPASHRFVVGFLLARYREIFFAMLSLALSMILYGVLVKTESLGSTDGFSVIVPTFFGYAPHRTALLVALYWLVLAVCAIAALLVDAYFRSVAGALAVPMRDNEIRVEFLGISVVRLIHIKLVISGVLAGIGGALAALAIGHVDPNMSYWTTSGELRVHHHPGRRRIGRPRRSSARWCSSWCARSPSPCSRSFGR